MQGPELFSGIVVDGDHGEPNPVNDAVSGASHLAQTGVILLHDFSGAPVWKAAVRLMEMGFRCKVYYTAHMVGCCWRGTFEPPAHQRDPRIDWATVERCMSGFPFARCE
jgi:hypothetical protein